MVNKTKIPCIFALVSTVSCASGSSYTNTPAANIVETCIVTDGDVLNNVATSITPTNIASHISILAADSMKGRDTPSRGLDMTVQYITNLFKDYGLEFGGDSASFIQLYPSPVSRRNLAPNVVGLLTGSDSVLKDEYIIISAHMDHIGTRYVSTSNADSIYNGADDNASGTSAVLEIAKAFSSLEVLPKRSFIFLLVSGKEGGLWGSRWFVYEDPPVEREKMVANLNLDMIGRNWQDTIVAIGKEHSTLGDITDCVASENLAIGLTPIEDPWPEERYYYRSDHYNFASYNIPILFFFNGLHEDYHKVTDEADKIDNEKVARVARLVAFTALEVANRTQRPEWNPNFRLDTLR